MSGHYWQHKQGYKEFPFSDSYRHYMICGCYINDKPQGVVNYYNIDKTQLYEQITFKNGRHHGRGVWFWDKKDNKNIAMIRYCDNGIQGEYLEFFYE